MDLLTSLSHYESLAGSLARPITVESNDSASGSIQIVDVNDVDPIAQL